MRMEKGHKDAWCVGSAFHKMGWGGGTPPVHVYYVIF